jgi:uncharacterized protein
MTDELVQAVRSGYGFTGPALNLGALVADGAADPRSPVRIPLAMVNRHGLVAGATGTGKTKTLQLMSEQLSAAGVPVFLADIKGDLSGIAAPGTPSTALATRTSALGQDWKPTGYPVEYYALGGVGAGVPVRATVSSFGPILLAKVLGLTEVQSSALAMVFHFADGSGLPLLDLKDLRAVIQYLTSDDGAGALRELGALSKQTAGVLLRELITFADTGADRFFGEPEFDTADLLRTTPDGRGIVSVMELPGVAEQPALFSTFLMWLLADLFHDLPEVGDVERPKLVFFLDEAHLLFADASRDFLESVTQTVRLIRSKGVGVFFVTQSPRDVPGDVLAQLGSRVQHALRAYTPEDAKALKATVSTYPRSGYDLEKVLTELGIGEAVVTVLGETGAPTPVAWTRLYAPRSLMGPATPASITAAVQASPLQQRYGQPVDRESAYERLAARVLPESQPAPAPQKARNVRTPEQEQSLAEKVLGNSAAKALLRSAGAAAGAALGRSLFGTAKRRR